MDDFDRLVDEARRLDCLISGGSDCHAAPGTGATTIGCSPAPESVALRIAAVTDGTPT